MTTSLFLSLGADPVLSAPRAWTPSPPTTIRGARSHHCPVIQRRGGTSARPHGQGGTEP